MLTFATLKEKRQRRSVVVAYTDDVEVTFYYDPLQFSPNLVRLVDETAIDSVVNALSALLTGWSLPDADPTAANLMHLSVFFLAKVFRAIMNDITVGDFGVAARNESPGNFSTG